MNCPYSAKICTKCKELLIVCELNFTRRKDSKDGFRNECKRCKTKYNKQYREEHKEVLAEKRKEYYEENKEVLAEKRKEYYEEHKEEILIVNKQYREEHKEEMAEYKKQWNKKNQYRRFNSHNKRRQLEENQGRDITKEQWYEMMCWFDWCCAYSGKYIGGDNTDKKRTTDHIIPISKGGLNEPWNCIPCFANYNYSKNTRNMLEWYIQQEFYSEERLINIYAWCEYAWNKWKPRRKGNKKNS